MPSLQGLTGWWRRSALGAVGRRLALAVPLLAIVSALSFVLLSLTPGDPAREVLGVNGTPQQVAALRAQLGLDEPLPVQYWRWMGRALHGDLGLSIFSGETVTGIIGERAGVTASLLLGALVVAVVVGVAAGVWSAVRGGFSDRLADALALVGFALPTVWLGAILIEVFAVRLKWLPAVGYAPPTQGVWPWLRGLLLPVATLAVGCIAVVAKNTREAMLDVLATEHIRLARANGVPERTIIGVYAMKVVATRVVTIVSLLTIGLLGGTVLVEAVFGLPGLGGELVTAVVAHDVPVVQGIVFMFTIVIVLINLVTDLLYRTLDPRLHAR